MPYTAPFSKKRALRAGKSDNQINAILTSCLNLRDIKSAPIEEDLNGVDKFGMTQDGKEITFQVKMIEYMGFDTITCPVSNYEQYKNGTVDYFVHGYFDKDTPHKVRQYVVLPCKAIPSPSPLRSSGITGTDFYYWHYKMLSGKFDGWCNARVAHLFQ